MASNIGYFMGGMAKGLTAGANIGMQITQIKWQKKKQKELDDLTVKMNDSWNSIGQELISLANDGQLSEDDKLKIYTLTIAAPYEMQGVMQNLRSSLAQFDTKGFDSQMELVKTFYDYAQGMDVTDIDALYETFRGKITDPHALALFEVCDRKLRHEFEAGKIKEKLDISEKLPGPYKYPYLKEEGLVGEITPTTKAPTMADEKSAITLLKTFVRATPEQFEAQRARIEQRTGLDLSVYTQEILRETGSEIYNLYNTPDEVLANVKAPEGSGLMVVPSRDSKTGKYYATFQKKTTTPGTVSRVTSLPLQEDYKQKALDANTLEDKKKVVDTYEKAGYDLSEMPTDQEWIDAKLEELNSHVEMLEEITDGEGRLMGSKSFKFMSGDKAETQTGEQWYKEIYEAYMFYLKELRKMGIDVSKYPKIKSPEEVSKVGFLKGMFTGGGVERGYPSIYYTETTPTPTETEIPKLPSL